MTLVRRSSCDLVTNTCAKVLEYLDVFWRDEKYNYPWEGCLFPADLTGRNWLWLSPEIHREMVEWPNFQNGLAGSGFLGSMVVRENLFDFAKVTYYWGLFSYFQRQNKWKKTLYWEKCKIWLYTLLAGTFVIVKQASPFNHLSMYLWLYHGKLFWIKFWLSNIVFMPLHFHEIFLKV